MHTECESLEKSRLKARKMVLRDMRYSRQKDKKDKKDKRTKCQNIAKVYKISYFDKFDKEMSLVLLSFLSFCPFLTARHIEDAVHGNEAPELSDAWLRHVKSKS